MINFPADRTAMALAKEYFMKRAISPDTIKACGLEVAGRSACLEAIGSTRRTNYSAGILIPYTDTYRTVRWLGTNESSYGTKLNDDPKLLAPLGLPHTYIPNLPACSGEDFDGVVYICESAMKAIALAQHGYYALAGNGVDGLYNQHGFAIGWPDALMSTEVNHAVILFDSDWATNANVAAAIRRQATGISNHYPNINIVHKALEHGPEGSWGIDDAIAANGLPWLHEWLGGPDGDREIEVSPLQRHLDELNDGYVLCHKPMAIIKQGNNELYKRGDFTDMLEAPRCYKEKQGKGPMVKISPAKEWLEWDDRKYVDRLVYTPGQAVLEGLEYNTWKDDGVVAIADGDVEPFLQVYRNAIPDAETRDLLIQSMAYMLQNRGTKLDKTFLLVGNQVGTGKSLFVTTMGKLFGRSNYSSIGVEDFTGDFNSAFTAKEIVLLDDLYKLGRPAMAKLKRYVTDTTVMVNPKGVQQYEIDNHAVYFMTSNEYVSLSMDSNERRVLVCEFDPVVHYPTGSTWWSDYIAWLEYGGGYGLLRGWLEQVDLEGFDPNYMPPMSAAKRHIVNATKNPEEQWVMDLVNDVNVTLLGNKRSVYTTTELWALYTGSGELATRSEAIAFGRALSNAGFRQANDSKPCKVNGKAGRYVVVRAGGDWDSKAVIADVRKYGTLTLG